MANQWATATGDPAYARAFAKIASDPTRGHLLWDGDEQRAYRAVASVQANMRSMSHTDNAGGYMVPLVLDPSILISNAFVVSNWSILSRTVRFASHVAFLRNRGGRASISA